MAEDVKILGKYVLKENIGNGAMGSVWLSSHPRLDLPVAVKILDEELAKESTEYVQRFIEEGRTAAIINHPNIVRIYDADHDSGYHFLVMEYVDGCNIGQLAKQKGGALPWEEVMELGIKMAEALKEAQSVGIVHRDIKPENIMVTTSGKLKLADLGIAKRYNYKSGIEEDGYSIGTPHYISPEQSLDSRNANHHSDIYSLGATMYHLLTGNVPFDDTCPKAVMMKHVQEPLEHPKTVKGDLPDNICAVVCKMMEKSPFARYKTYEDLLDDLYKIKHTNADVNLLSASMSYDTLAKNLKKSNKPRSEMPKLSKNDKYKQEPIKKSQRVNRKLALKKKHKAFIACLWLAGPLLAGVLYYFLINPTGKSTLMSFLSGEKVEQAELKAKEKSSKRQQIKPFQKETAKTQTENQVKKLKTQDENNIKSVAVTSVPIVDHKQNLLEGVWRFPANNGGFWTFSDKNMRYKFIKNGKLVNSYNSSYSISGNIIKLPKFNKEWVYDSKTDTLINDKGARATRKAKIEGIWGYDKKDAQGNTGFWLFTKTHMTWFYRKGGKGDLIRSHNRTYVLKDGIINVHSFGNKWVYDTHADVMRDGKGVLLNRSKFSHQLLGLSFRMLGGAFPIDIQLRADFTADQFWGKRFTESRLTWKQNGDIITIICKGSWYATINQKTLAGNHTYGKNRAVTYKRIPLFSEKDNASVSSQLKGVVTTITPSHKTVSDLHVEVGGSSRDWSMNDQFNLTDFRYVYHSELSPNKRLLALIYNEKLEVVDLQNKKTLFTAPIYKRFKHNLRYTTCIFSKDNRYLFVGSHDSKIRTFDIKLKAETASLPLESDPYKAIQKIAWNPSRNLASYIYGTPSILKVYDLSSNRDLREFPLKEGYYRNVTFSNKQHWVVAGAAKQASIWDIKSGQRICQLGEETGLNRRIFFSPDDSYAVSVTSKYIDGTGSSSLVVYSVPNGKKLFEAKTGTIHSLQITNNNQYMIYSDSLTKGSYTSKVIFRDLKTGREAHVLTRPKVKILGVHFLSDESMLLLEKRGKVGPVTKEQFEPIVVTTWKLK